MAVAEHLLPEDSTERCEREFLSDARVRVDAFMADAGLTEREHHVYWLRVGHLRSWRDIGRMLAPERARVDASGAAMVMVGAFRRGHRKLSILVSRRGMWRSPLHPANPHARSNEQWSARLAYRVEG